MVNRVFIVVVAAFSVGTANAELTAQTKSAEPNQRAAPVQSPDGVASFLKQYCVRCHGPEKPKGDVALDQLATESFTGARVKTWKQVFHKIKSGEMPPENAPKAARAQRENVLKWIESALGKAGVAVDDGKWLSPSRGNWVDHDALFSGKSTAPTATRGRLWRLTGKAYEEFVQSLNVKYRLRFRTYGHRRVRAPWQLSPSKGFRDFASQHRIGESEIEHHLRNANRVARAMIARIPKSRIREILPLRVVLQAGRTSTQKQILSASRAAFGGILGRRPSTKESRRYAGFLQASLKSLTAEKAIEQLLVAILFHPEVMYRIELPVLGATRALIPPRDLARTIAFALTDRKPDAILLKAVADGRLSNRGDVRAQIVRILNDRGIAKPRILRFFQEYFGYTRAIDVFKDSATRKASGFRGKNDWHPNFFVSDADRLVEWILESDNDVLRELLTTSKTFALTGNTKQAKGVKRNASKPFSLFAQTALDIYEIKISRKEWSDANPFKMPDRHRMGILTHPSWLIAHSTNFDNHAIDRGRWIRERLLGGKIPDIPVTVDAQLPDEPKNTLRMRMRVTRKAYCWKCHQYMDPLGLPFEQFDHFGRFRTTEMDDPVDTSGSVERSGDPKLNGAVKDPFALIQSFASSKRVEQVFVRHAFRYFLGRNESLRDGPILVSAHRSYVKSGGSMKALIASLLTSDAFLYRTVANEQAVRRPAAERKKEKAMIERRELLKGVSLGAGSLVFSPLMKSLAAQVDGRYTVPKRVVFVLFDNGFHETAAQPKGVPLEGGKTRSVPLKRLSLPKDIDPFTPYKDRLTIVQGLRGAHLSPNHGAGFGALSGVAGGLGEDKFRRVVAESIDAAIARVMPGIFPLLVLGIDPGKPETTTYYASSAWGPGKAIAAQCRPELAYESLFGSIGAKQNDFVTRKNLLDFVAGDVRRLRSKLAGPEREQLDYHLGALESLSRRETRLAAMKSAGKLEQHAPKMPALAPKLMPDVLTSQFDIAASALMTGLTNVVTITSGLCRIRGNYSGFSKMGVHSAGHNKKDSGLGIMGNQVLARVRNFIAQRTAGLMKKLQSIPEGKGTMLDNTLLVFTSDSANRQHTSGENWPFVLVGNLGGRLKTGQLVAYPMKERGKTGEWKYHGSAAPANPTINALYCTLLHAVGAPRKHFNLTTANKDNRGHYGPLLELLT